MSANVISLQRIGKAYRMWSSPAARLISPAAETLSRLLPGAAGRWFARKAGSQYRDFWALRDVSFDIRKGETIGIIGRNGSGKSTLLQIIAGTLQPTTGTLQRSGRIAALLELGSGFNPDFTGRENVYLNGAVLGLSRREIDLRFADIAEFADIGEFIDQPVKTYSSGMLVRLAFAVQIQVNPDILIVDEALSVGDEPFQRKCFSQIAQMQERGVTILFVSHAAATIAEICQRVILLDHGRCLLVARPKTAIRNYHRLCYTPAEELDRLRGEILASHEAGAENPVATSPATPPTGADPAENFHAYYLESMRPTSRSEFPSRGAVIESAQILDQQERPVNVLVKGADYTLRCQVRFTQTATRVRFGWTAKNLTGLPLSGAATHPVGEGFERHEAGSVVEVDFPFQCLFNPGTYFLDCAVRGELEEVDALIHGITDVLMFKVQPTPRQHRNGYIDTSGHPAWNVKLISTQPR